MLATVFSSTLTLTLLLGPTWDPQTRPDTERRLVICLDGVAHGDFESVQLRGRFRYLKPAGRLISPFPSLTNPAMVKILQRAGAPRAFGYEDRYFCGTTNQMRGGIGYRLSQGFIRDSFRRLFDFHPAGLDSSVEYMVPPYSCRGMVHHDLEEGLRAFKKSDDPFFLLYIGATDCAAHTGGQASIRGLLKHLDRKLCELLKQRPDTAITIFSDHGNSYARYKRVDLVAVLEGQGYRVGSEVGSANAVVVPRFGLIGSALIHSRPDRAADIARIISRVEGVHFATVRQERVVRLFSQGEEAVIEQTASSLTYSPGKTDPLDLGPTATHSPEKWFELTRAHRYPDAVNRLWDQCRDVVVNHPAVLISFHDGFYSGSKILDLFVTLKATHGSLSAEQSLGFLACSEREVPEYVGAAEAWEYIGAERDE